MDFQYLVIDRIRIRYIDINSEGNPILLIHGLGGSIESWIKNIYTISKNFRVIAVDLPGFGFSDKPKINYTITFYKSFIVDFIKRLKIGSPISIVGSSLGGHIAAEVAINHPELVFKLILISPAGALPFSFKGTPALRNYMNVLKARSIQEIKKALSSIDDNPCDEDSVKAFYEKLSTVGAKKAFMSAYKGSAEASRLCRRLKRIKVAVLLIWGKDDRIIPVKFINPFLSVKNCRIILLENCGHRPNIDKPVLFNSIVTDFIQEKEG
jgi:2-hydroxy-6-oxonona-2,4-dienedioate hydrolase